MATVRPSEDHVDLTANLRALGLPLPAVPQFADITAAAVLIARTAAMPLTRLLQRATVRPGGRTTV